MQEIIIHSSSLHPKSASTVSPIYHQPPILGVAIFLVSSETRKKIAHPMPSSFSSLLSRTQGLLLYLAKPRDGCFFYIIIHGKRTLIL